MADIGEAFLKSAKTRLYQAKDIHDNPAKPLVDGYASRKLQHGRFPIRDWNWTGGTIRSLAVLTASENRCTIGPSDGRADFLITVNNKKVPQWPESPKDREATYKEIRDTLTRVSSVSIHWREVA
jgi:hypothetical protein